VDGSPTVVSYLRFTVSGVGGSVVSASLMIYANSSGSHGVVADAVSDNSWGELTTTHSNAPAVGGQIGTSAGFSSGSWVTIDVTSYITGNGTYSLAITDPTATAISLASRESGANAPQLVIALQ